MKVKNMVWSVAVAVMMAGCSTNEPAPSTKNEIVTLENGKRYSVPVGSIYTKAPVTKRAIARYTELGVKGCQDGDITWEDQTVSESINSMMRNGTKEEGVAIVQKAAKEGTIGCASPLPDA